VQFNRPRHLVFAASVGLALAAASFGCAKVETAPSGTTGGVGLGDAGVTVPDAGASVPDAGDPSAPETGNAPPAAPPFVLPTSSCGDGVVQSTETCDDRNAIGGDGCSASCALEPGWTCAAAGEACERAVACGDHVIEGRELCDDGNTTDGDGCSSGCSLECGWECPPGVACRAARCGDGNVAGAEQCDDGNAAAGDGCSPLCTLESKPATTAEGWACTSAKTAGGCAGPTVCKATTCGNAQKEGSEQCDDGNSVTGDGCSPLCRLEPTCPAGGGPCSTVCGSGLLLPGDKKQCDDGNTVGGDGCSATCTIEPGFACTNVPVNPNPLVLPVVYHDFKAWQEPGGHPDFDHWIGYGQVGMAQPALGTDPRTGGVPVHVPACVKLTANNCPSDGTPAWDPAIDWFGMWYTDAPTYNKTIVKTLTLAPIAGGTFQYNDEAFFPLDGVAGTWGNTPGFTHNYGFTSVTRSWFEYAGPATLTFVGDDDVFVYINKKLAVDLGGTHHRATGSITLDPASGTGYSCDFVAPGAAGGACDPVAKTGGHVVDLGLVKGNVYEIAVFQAERHTVDSHYQLTLSKFTGTKSACVGACGDGVVTPPETCDLGKAKNTGAHGGCNADCTLAPYCGDKVVQAAAGEECDSTANCDGNCKVVVVK
jgi:fibro-slime domain-containing protein